ncbi:Piwi domain-containing protein [Lentimicrobium sp. S6]|uniref:Piwi domain-containing protein n=1 Tax=Lentimicrobium sp. S6 TaxID=2735872 RepID=UPI001556A37A|nr:Piwi domain-containing protein [Lentimicrobium sp. S6]NPD47962.1 hypothetical protein [Lentimicrobium sp. S6]
MNQKQTTQKVANHHISNSISFSYKEGSILLGVFAEGKKGRKGYGLRYLQPLVKEWLDQMTHPQEKYWIGCVEEDALCTFMVQLSEQPYIAKWYLTQQLFQHLSEKTRICKRLFTGDWQYWVEDGNEKHADRVVFKKFSLFIITKAGKNSAQLMVSYEGSSSVLKSNVQSLVRKFRLDTHLIGQVIFEKRSRSYAHLKDEFRLQSECLHPILRREMAAQLRMDFPFSKEAYKLKKAYEEIEIFRQQFLNNEEIKYILPLSDRWSSVPLRFIQKIAYGGRLLQFGGEKVESDIYRGFSQNGPFLLPKAPHYKVFFIYCESGKSIKSTLEKHLGEEAGYQSLQEISHMDLVYDADLDIYVESSSDIVERVETHIKQLEKESDTQYFAFYISPYGKFDNKPAHKKVYYRVKELLLKRGIMSQSIEQEKNRGKNLNYFMPNIAMAMVAKFGGIPWKLARETEKELIVGFGAFRSSNKKKPFVGSAFCFDNEGRFQEFDCFAAEEEWALVGMLGEAIKNYRQQYRHVKRLIIHYYKELNNKEMEQVEALLEQLEENIPVIVVRINNSFKHKELAWNSKHPQYLPLNGSYIHLRYQDYLLHINENEGVGTECKTAPYPMKVSLQSNVAGLVNDPELVRQLMQQLYDFSLLHWRSIKQPRLPVTIAYPQMLARIFPYFDAEVLQELGRTRLWFI